MTIPELREFLEEKSDLYNRPSFIPDDPVSIPHLFTRKEDIEISALLTSVISWGQRKTILKNARLFMQRMDMSPYQFVCGHSQKDLTPLKNLKHRTFQYSDLLAFIRFLRSAYGKGGLQKCFFEKTNDVPSGIENARKQYLVSCRENRSKKHFPSPASGSAAKRMNMFLRWMVRRDKRGVDFGIWDEGMIPKLMCPLDVHSGRIARMLGLLQRKQNDWNAVEELTANLRLLDPADPVKYDFALFGLGVNEKEVMISKKYTRK